MGEDGQTYPLRTLVWPGPSIIDVRAVRASYGNLLVLADGGIFFGLDSETGVSAKLCAVELPVLPPLKDESSAWEPAYRLHASSDGRYAAVVIDHGQEGIVAEVATGLVTMRLHGGDYLEETVSFSACFLTYQGRDVLVYRSDWNRLDVADPARGRSLTPRHILPYETGMPRPEHHLDYFHGRLDSSPDGRYLFDDGWVWHPLSVPTAWSVSEWLDSNPFESEDGSSLVSLTARDDWNTPSCWIDGRLVAIWGIGEWKKRQFCETGRGPGVRILDVTEKEQSSSRRWPMDVAADHVLDLFCDGSRLYVAANTGTTVWDIASRSRIATFPGFVARLLDPVRGVLVAVAPDSVSEVQLPWCEANSKNLSDASSLTGSLQKRG